MNTREDNKISLVQFQLEDLLHPYFNVSLVASLLSKYVTNKTRQVIY